MLLYVELLFRNYIQPKRLQHRTKTRQIQHPVAVFLRAADISTEYHFDSIAESFVGWAPPTTIPLFGGNMTVGDADPTSLSESFRNRNCVWRFDYG